ncbi:MAG: AAA ATPase central domain protein [Candidatus Magasanikbacteria bacterium GW2011_GWA2_45_39]|uniref:Replication-associated recombination protein A n=1 Tax=Candidatus Magasanikbacteria bacterium GW2011_GWA2_45_39 TaxID=1619041 RepID=A0A0G1MH55_9BACT|nr:MAG: AAA ATPase central domain protein [Candidatus Magasanikbacteria bacterium GW2011_GWA2_45_39]HBW74244.1 AAA family ATPase [Candidatus Magasanikbacteria bacterium]
MSLTLESKDISRPLADRMRPVVLADIVGQDHILGMEKMLRRAIEDDRVPSLMLWGPPGTGKTTIAQVIARATGAAFVQLSAVENGVKDIRAVLEAARTRSTASRQKTILFVDEIHRFNKGQQDALLSAVENGTIILIGATTENPSFSLNAALISRCRVFVLNALEPEHIKILLGRAVHDVECGLGFESAQIEDGALEFLATMSNGDARVALNALQLAGETASAQTGATPRITLSAVKESLQRTHLLYDKSGEEHYNIISALHKSMRGGDASAALYWLGRMLEAGEDPLYIARRIIRFASEDIGIANSLALSQAVAAYQACSYIGMPECGVNLAQAVVYMAKSKKSIALYTAYLDIQKDICELPNEPVPIHLCNAPTKLMKTLGYGKGYKYTPEFVRAEDAAQDFLPEKMKHKKYIE